MSRFFQALDDSSSSSSDEEEEELVLDKLSGQMSLPSNQRSAARVPMARFLLSATGGAADSSSDSSDDDSDAESDDEDKKGAGGGEFSKIIKSARHKRSEEISDTAADIANKVKINDWPKVVLEFDKMIRLIEKLDALNEPAPPAFFRSLSDLENSVAAEKTRQSQSAKKINADIARAFNSMKQRLKKTLLVSINRESVDLYKSDPQALQEQYDKLVEVAFGVTMSQTQTRDVRRAAASAARKSDAAKAAAAEDEDAGDDFEEVGKGGRVVQLTSENVLDQLKDIADARGKKNTDKSEALKKLEKILNLPSLTPYQTIRAPLAVLSARFDFQSVTLGYMPIDQWTSAQSELRALLTLLSEQPDYLITESSSLEYSELVPRSPSADEPVILVRGSIISYIDRLDDEFTKSLQNIDPHVSEYVTRLQDESSLYSTIFNAQSYFEISLSKTKDATLQEEYTDALARCVYRRLEHVYCKPDIVLKALESYSSANSLKTAKAETNTSSESLIASLATHLYKGKDSLLRTRAMLSHIYHHALHNRFYEARDMFLMSRLQDSIGAADVSSQILYNRSVVQLGMCAFRQSLIKECQIALNEIFHTGRVKELLAQGSQGLRFISAEQERTEKLRELPFHMHINFELLEAAFLTSSMLLDIPTIAAAGTDVEARKRAGSKYFKRQYDYYDRQAFNGPPETSRDHIMYASKCLQSGEWKKCRTYISNIAIWNLLPDSQSLKELLAKKIQEEALRTYLFNFSSHYDNVSLNFLATEFELPVRKVASIISKMICHDELAATLDQVNHVVTFSRVELSSLQQLAQNLADKTHHLYEQNERGLENKLNDGQERGEKTDRREGNDRGSTGERRGGRGRGRGRGGSSGRGGGGRGAYFSEGLGQQRRIAV